MTTHKRIVRAAYMGATAALVVGLLALPGLVSVPAAARAGCDALAMLPDRCRFDGAPLRTLDRTVYLDGRPLPFVPLAGALQFTDAAGTSWVAPPETLTDGASIPSLFIPVLGMPMREEFRLAAALHDAYCGVGNEALPTFRSRPWDQVHRMFYDALLVAGTPPQQAKLMFAAVYLGGPRWNDPPRAMQDMPDEMLMQMLHDGMDFILQEDPPPGAIEEFLTDKEYQMRATLQQLARN